MKLFMKEYAIFVLVLASSFAVQASEDINSTSVRSQLKLDETACTVEASSFDGYYFRHLMETENEVDLVRIRLDWMGRDFNHSSEDYFDPDTWVWASHSSGEALLSLPFDVDILSLGTLTKDIFNMEVQMNFEPEDCNQILTNAEKNILVARALYMNVTSGFNDAILCHRVVAKGTNTLQYRCCELDTYNSTHFECDITVRKQVGVIYSLTFIEVLSFIAVFYLPVIAIYLPNPCHEDPTEFGTEKRLMYLNVEVPVGIGKLGRIIYRGLSSRAKRIVLFFLIFIGMTVTWNLLYFFIKYRELDMRISRGIATPLCTFPFLDVFFDPSSLKIVGVSILVVAMLFIAILVCVIGKTGEVCESLADHASGKCLCLTCRLISTILNVPSPLVDTENIKTFQSYLSTHLKIIFGNVFCKGLKSFILKPFNLFNNTIISVICFLLWILPSVIVVICFVLLLTPVFISILFLMSVFFIYLTKNNTTVCIYAISIIVLIIVLFGSAGYVFVIFFISILQLMRLLGFTIMGLLVHAQFFVPFIVYGLSIVFYFWNYWHQLYLRYFRLKMSIIQECEKQSKSSKNSQSLQEDANVPPEIIFYNKQGVPAIPRELFHIVCRELMPVRVNIAVTCFKFFVILIFLSFVLTCIVSFGKFKDFSALTKTLATLAMSALPKLLSILGSSSYNDVSKAKRQHELSFIVSEYATGRIKYARGAQARQEPVYQHAYAEETL